MPPSGISATTALRAPTTASDPILTPGRTTDPTTDQASGADVYVSAEASAGPDMSAHANDAIMVDRAGSLQTLSRSCNIFALTGCASRDYRQCESIGRQAVFKGEDFPCARHRFEAWAGWGSCANI